MGLGAPDGFSSHQDGIGFVHGLRGHLSPRFPQDASGASKQPGVYSLPEWIRALALAAVVVNIAVVIGLGRRTSVRQNPD